MNEHTHIGIPLPNDLPSRAVLTATVAHAGQKYGDSPYIVHPLEVMRKLRREDFAEGDYEIAQAVAACHDVLEDSELTPDDLSTFWCLPYKVIANVQVLTKTKGMSYTDYLVRVKACPIARRVKIADMQSNQDDCFEHLTGDEDADADWIRRIDKYDRGLGFLSLEDEPDNYLTTI